MKQLLSLYGVKRSESVFLFIPYFITAVGLFLYSFTQVDLGLTLTRLPLGQIIIHFFQRIGYFNRPLSTTFYLVILVWIFALYLLMLILVQKQRVARREVWFILMVVSIIAMFSYNAFSYDLFNYIFDAKIFTFYNQNPYLHKALDFPTDPMLGFMHWTQRTFPYGPVWLLVTIPFSYLGLQYFLPTLVLFKFLMFSGYIGTVYFIGRILRKIAPSSELFSVVFFGLNPLVIIESLVSAHNDIIMMFFMILSLYLLIEKKYFFALLFFIASVGIKFATVFVLPVLIVIVFMHAKKKNVHWGALFSIACASMIVPVILASLRTNFQPWYLLYMIPFTALVSRKYYVLIPTVIISAGALLEYVLFLSTGNWDPPIPTILYWVIIGSVVLALLVTLLYYAGIMLVSNVKHDRIRSYGVGTKV